MKNLKMAHKLGLGFGLITLLVCVLGYVGYLTLTVSSQSINKLVNGYIPVSDLASTILDDVRQVRIFIRQYEVLGLQEDLSEVHKNLDAMAKEFERLKALGARYPELTTLAAALNAYPPLYAGYKEGCNATAREMERLAIILKQMQSSAQTLESNLEQVLAIILANQQTAYASGDLENLQSSATNFSLAAQAEVDFKEMRRLYAMARLTYDVSVKPKMQALGNKALSSLKGLESRVVNAQSAEKVRNATQAATAYLTDMNSLMQAWEGLAKASEHRRASSSSLVDLLEKLNIAANRNAETFASKSEEQLNDNIQLLSVLFGGVLSLAVLLALVLTRLITVPLRLSLIFAQAVAGGNLDETLRVQARDEVGKLADALREMVGSLKGKIREAADQAEEARKMSDEAKAAMEEARHAQAAAESARREGMLTAARQLEGIVEVVSSASTELTAQVEESERGTAITSERLSEAATAMEEMNATVLEVARSAGNASGVSTEARQKAEQGSVIVDNVVNCITDVEKQSTQLKTDMVQLGRQAEAIGTIMNVISDIADQTNLLALNAAIEAARAGEAGRGFAVVADEVRKLAEKTMQATVEVGNAIRGVQNSAEQNMRSVELSSQSVARATDLARQAGEALREIVNLVDASADQVRTIATAAEEQSATSEEINHSLGKVNSTSSETARAMAEAAQAVSDLSQQAQKLSRLIEDMKRG